MVAAHDARSFLTLWNGDRARSSVRPLSAAFPEAAGRYGDPQIRSKIHWRALHRHRYKGANAWHSLSGLCEVASKSTLFYVDQAAKYLVIERVYDMEARQDLTAARLLALNPDLLAAGEETAPPLMRQLRRQLKAAQQKADLASEAPAQNADVAEDDTAPLEGAAPYPTPRLFRWPPRLI